MSRVSRWLAFASLVSLLAPLAIAQAPIEPRLHTAAVPHDADDPAIWVNRADPSRSLIVGTDKAEETGGLYVFGLNGALLSSVVPLDRPNNVDVEYGLSMPDGAADIVVTTERMRHRLRVFAIDDGAELRDLAPDGLPLFEDASGLSAEPMGIALYKRPSDATIFAIVAPKAGPTTGYLWQYRLYADAAGIVHGTFVRRFGTFSGVGEIEAVAVDDELGFVYYSDEQFGIRKYAADPDAADPNRELAAFGMDQYLGDREGLAIFVEPGGRGYIVSSDQVGTGTRLHLYPRQGVRDNPHSHPRLAVVPTVADETDGLEVASTALPDYPAGLLVMMNSEGHDFLLFDWTAVGGTLPPHP